MARVGGTWRPGGVSRNTALNGLRTAARFVTAFALLPFLLTGLGAERTGLFLFATTLTGYFAAIELGVGTGVTRYVAEYRASKQQEQLASLLRGSLLLMLAIGGVVGLILAAVGVVLDTTLFDEPILRGDVTPTLLAAALTSVVYWPSRLGVAALNGLERYDQGAIVGIVVSLAELVALAVLAHAGASVAVLTLVFGSLSSLEGVVAAALAWSSCPSGVGMGHRWGSHLKPVASSGGAVFAWESRAPFIMPSIAHL